MEATTIVASGEMFLFGGRNHETLLDVWRYRPLQDTWTELLAAPATENLRHPFSAAMPRPFGRSAVISPWGILAIGGRSATSRNYDPMFLWRYQPQTQLWDTLQPSTLPQDGQSRLINAGGKNMQSEYDHSDSARFDDFGEPVDLEHELRTEGYLNDPAAASHETLARQIDPSESTEWYMLQDSISASTSNDIPLPRALHALAIGGLAGTETRLRGVAQPALYLYGGSSNSGEYNDLWHFALEEVKMQVPANAAESAQLEAALKNSTLHEQRAADAGTGIGGTIGAGSVVAGGFGMPHAAVQSSNQLQQPPRMGADVFLQMAGVKQPASNAPPPHNVATSVDAAPADGYAAGVWWERECAWRIVPGSAADQHWQQACLATSTSSTIPCRLDDVLLRAICEKRFQSIGSV
jgi:hypothetical protein